MKTKSIFKNSVCVLAVLAIPGNALAQDDNDDEIIVTATKRAQSIQDVPFSINAQTQEDIQRIGATNLEDISRNVAGLAIQNLGPVTSQGSKNRLASILMSQ